MSYQLESKVASIERDLWAKASSSDLDAANRRIRELRTELDQEKRDRQYLEERYDQKVRDMEDRLDSLFKAVEQECPGCSKAGGADRGIKHLPPLCP